MIQSALSRLSDNPLLVLALLKFLLHLTTNAFWGYGYFRDEFYYIACTDHLDLGYVDHPPLSIIILWLNRILLGDSLFALRILPALAGGALVYLTGLIVRELGGGKSAQVIAGLAVIIAPIYLILHDLYSMNAFESLFWMGTAYILIQIFKTDNQKLWLWFGVLAGLGMQNKHSMAFFGFALLLGIVVTTHRQSLVSRWFWLGGMIAFFLFLPNLIWQMLHDWATVEFMQNAQQWKNMPMSPAEFLSAQVLLQHPVALPLWIAGVVSFFASKKLEAYRPFGWTFIALLILFIVQRGKPYYLSPMYPLILGAGAVLVEEFVMRKQWRWALKMYAAGLIVGGAITLPLSLPILPPEVYVRYSEALGIQEPKMERHVKTALPQVYADRFGWNEMVETVATIYKSLPPDEKSVAAIYTQNYGEAGAIDFLGKEYGLPRAISGHNNYWLWGPRGYTGKVVIIVGGDADDHREVFASVERIAVHTHPYAMAYESNLPIFICRTLKVPFSEVWKKTKHYI